MSSGGVAEQQAMPHAPILRLYSFQCAARLNHISGLRLFTKSSPVRNDLGDILPAAILQHPVRLPSG